MFWQLNLIKYELELRNVLTSQFNKIWVRVKKCFDISISSKTGNQESRLLNIKLFRLPLIFIKINVFFSCLF